MEFGFVCLLACVKFYYSALEDGDKVHYEVVVGLLLLAGGEAGINRHFIYINYYYTSSLKLLGRGEGVVLVNGEMFWGWIGVFLGV